MSDIDLGSIRCAPQIDENERQNSHEEEKEEEEKQKQNNGARWPKL